MEFKPGFRIFITDIIFIVALAIFAVSISSINRYLSIIIFLPCIQFFLFCNVFRIRRKTELIWATLYLIVGYCGYYFQINTYLIAFILLTTGMLLIFREFKHPGYHGIMWRRINPNLEYWFKENISD